MNCYRFTGHAEHVFVGVPVAPTTFPWRNDQQVDAPFGSPVVLQPGDLLVTWVTLEHPLLELTDEHPFAPRPRPPRPSRSTRPSRPARRSPEE